MGWVLRFGVAIQVMVVDVRRNRGRHEVVDRLVRPDPAADLRGGDIDIWSVEDIDSAKKARNPSRDGPNVGRFVAGPSSDGDASERGDAIRVAPRRQVVLKFGLRDRAQAVVSPTSAPSPSSATAVEPRAGSRVRE